MSDLWSEQRTARRAAVEPLAARMRPRTLAEFVGQEQILGPGRLLRRMLDAGSLTSIVVHGPPGTGKTTLAAVIAAHVNAHFESSNAAMIGVARIREVLDAAARRLEERGTRTILFLDEIHRFARNQQDVLLADVERGTVILVGATTENPWFAVNGALVSRSTVFRLEPLSEEAVGTLLRRAAVDPRGLGELALRLDDDAVAHWARTCDGDARRALTALEVAAMSLLAERHGGAGGALPPTPADPLHITLAVAAESIQRKALQHDAAGDDHYDLASALIKSMRGGDPQGAIHWLARMLEAGEDPRFIARRVAILASEDIGLADPRALELAASAWSVVERVGMPECQLVLAEAVLYMCLAPKSNACARAIWAAMEDVRSGRTIPVPPRLRDQTIRRQLGREAAAGSYVGVVEEYVSPHDDPARGRADGDHLGVDRAYYVPTRSGHEARVADRLAELRSLRGRAEGVDDGAGASAAAAQPGAGAAEAPRERGGPRDPSPDQRGSELES
ncbi:MAG TPA: replication-associated recombination protein A [Phycisphaerales bacterium]|nr:replication-associated recombination protein A [Phycisphaerales bacterium]